MGFHSFILDQSSFFKTRHSVVSCCRSINFK